MINKTENFKKFINNLPYYLLISIIVLIFSKIGN